MSNGQSCVRRPNARCAGLRAVMAAEADVPPPKVAPGLAGHAGALAHQKPPPQPPYYGLVLVRVEVKVVAGASVLGDVEAVDASSHAPHEMQLAKLIDRVLWQARPLRLVLIKEKTEAHTAGDEASRRPGGAALSLSSSASSSLALCGACTL